MICSISTGDNNLHPCTCCGELFTLAELYPNKGICEQCMMGELMDNAKHKKGKNSRTDTVGQPMSINRLFDNEDAWLDDEPWRKW